MIGQDSSELIVREPSPAEIGRVLHLFRAAPLPRKARVFVAVKTQPVERFIAAAAWWPIGSGDALDFRLTAQPGSTARFAAVNQLIQKIIECGHTLEVRSVRYADLLLDEGEWVPLLKDKGFRVIHSERFFEVSACESWTRTMEIAERMSKKFPPAWRTDSIRQHEPETILDFIEPYHLMPADEVRDRWRVDCPHGFELDLSAILFDGTRPVGAFLMRRKLDMLCVDVRVVETGNRLLDSLGNIALLRHTCVTLGPVPSDLNRLQFRGGQIEHRETANLAFRMGGNELPARHTFSRNI